MSLPQQIQDLTPLSYICCLDKTGKTPASHEFLKATETHYISFAFCIAAIASGHNTIESILALKRFDRTIFSRCQKYGYYTPHATGQVTVNHKPIFSYTLTPKGKEAWQRILSYTKPKIAKLQAKFSTTSTT